MNKKTIKYLIILAIIIFLGIVSFFAWQQGWIPMVRPSVLDETADWKTYRNKEYGFEISYPSNYNVSSDTQTDVAPALKADSYAQIIFRNFTYTRNEIELEKSKAEKVTVGSLDGYRSSIMGNMDGGIEFSVSFYDYPNTNNAFNVLFSTTKPGEEDEVNVFNQILSTFKFLETSGGETKTILVYLTDNKYDGNLGGRQGADLKCNPPPSLGCKNGTVHALITVNNDDSIKNVAKKYNLDINTPIYWYNRETSQKLILANNWNKMIEGNIENGQKEGTGKGEWAGDFPWTGGLGDGSALSTCNQWTSGDGDLEEATGPYGIIGGVEKEFLFASDGWAGISFSTVCKNTRYLRCICEGSI